MAEQKLLQMAVAHQEPGAAPKRELTEEDKQFIMNALHQPSGAELMKKQVERFNGEDATVEDKRAALEELQFYVEDGYNASDLHKVGGTDVAIAALTHEDTEVRINAAWVLATSLYHNEEVQRVVRERGGLDILLGRLKEEEAPGVLTKLVFALSAYLSNNEGHVDQFLSSNGVAALVPLLQRIKAQEYEACIKKAIFLLDRLTGERPQTVLPQLEASTPFLSALVQSLTAQDPDLIDKALSLIRRVSKESGKGKELLIAAGIRDGYLDTACKRLQSKEHGFNMEDAVAACRDLATFYSGQAI